MLNTPNLFAAAGAITSVIALAVFLAIHKPKLVAFILTISGILWALYLLTGASAEQFGADVRSWNLIGLNIMLAVFIWSTLIAWFEVYQRGFIAKGGGHDYRSPLLAFLAGFGLFSWSLNGLDLVGIAIVLGGCSAILAWKKAWPEVSTVLAVLAAVALAAGVAFLAGLARWQLWSIPVAWYVAFLTGIIGIGMVWGKVQGRRNNQGAQERVNHHHVGTPVVLAIFGISFMVAAGQGSQTWVQTHVEHTTTTTVAKVTKPGELPGPQGPTTILGRHMGQGILSALGAHHHKH